MIYLVSIYLFLFIFRPYEYWPVLGDLRIERVYMLLLMTAVFFWPGKRWISHSVNRYLAVFLMAMVLSSTFAINSQLAFLATWDLFKIVVFFAIIVLTVRDEEDLKKFLLAYMVIMLVYVGKSGWEFFLHDRHVYRMGIRRMIGVDTTYGDPNAFAASIAYSLPFLWALLRYRFDSVWARSLLWSYGGVALLAIVFTGSRSGMVTCLFFLVLLWWGSHRKLAGGVLLLVLLAGAWIKMPEDLKGRFLSTFNPAAAPVAQAKWAEESAQGRIAGLRQGIRLFTQNPVLGVGPGNFILGWDDPKIRMQAHNLYGQVLGELGLIGFTAFFTLVWRIYRTHRKNRRRIEELLVASAGCDPQSTRKLRFLQLAAAASMQTLLMLLFNGNFGHNLYRYNWLWIAAIGILTAWCLDRALVQPPQKVEFSPMERFAVTQERA